MNIRKTIEGKMELAVSSCGLPQKIARTEVSNRPDLSHFQCNGAMQAAKILGKNPYEIAEMIASKIENSDMDISVVRPGFINISLSDTKLTECINSVITNDYFGIERNTSNKKMILDYGGANIAKPLHIGHLRPAIIGEAMRRLCVFLGFDAISDVHLGDWGLQYGLIITELIERYGAAEEWSEIDIRTRISLEMLSEVYPTASSKKDEDEQYYTRALEATAKMQEGYPPYIRILRYIRDISVADVSVLYKRLNTHFDLWLSESDSQDKIPELYKLLEVGDFWRESDGAMVVDITEDQDNPPLPPAIVRKRNGSALYITTDIATLMQRVADYPELAYIWYFTDNRQKMHFTQVFRVAKKAGIVKSDIDLSFVPNGTMNGADGKPFRTRAGGTMLLSDLLDTVKNTAYAKLHETAKISDDGLRDDAAEKITIAAIKFGDLINQHSRDYIFDIDKFVSFEGKTGPYILYTAARINSILRKNEAQQTPVSITHLHTDIEKKIALKICGLDDLFWLAFNERSTSYLAQYVFELATLVNTFYTENHILNQTDRTIKSDWLSLLALCRKIIVFLMDILGIDCVDVM